MQARSAHSRGSLLAVFLDIARKVPTSYIKRDLININVFQTPLLFYATQIIHPFLNSRI